MIFTATFAAVAVSAAQDLWEIVAPSTTPVALREIRLGQYTDFGDAAAELLSIQIIRGYTTSGAAGAAVTPVNLRPWSRIAAATVERNNTTVAQDGTGAVLLADTFNVASGWWYRPPAEEFIFLNPSQRLVVRMTAPADEITMTSTIVFEENPRV